MKLDAYMLVRNEKYWLPMSLKSIYDLCDKIFIIDNGSTDGSDEIAKSFGSKVEVIYMPGDGFADPKTNEVTLRNVGIRACLDDGADMILRWDADEILYENQEEKIRDLYYDTEYGAWKFQCHRFVSDFHWVQDLREGEPGFMVEGSYELEGWGRQSGQGKLVLFRANPNLHYVPDPHYLGLHSSEFESVVPRRYRMVDIWYIHGEWCRSNKRLYQKTLLYYSLVADPNDYCHTEEFLSSIDPENIFKEQRLRPFGLRPQESSLPVYMEGFTLPVRTIVERDENGRIYVARRIWEGDDAI